MFGAVRAEGGKAMRRAVLLLLPLLAGCGSTTGRVYAWRPGAPNVLPAQLGIDHRLCVSEANRAYTPLIAGMGPKLTLYKDCMEKRGWVKAGVRSDGAPHEIGAEIAP